MGQVNVFDIAILTSHFVQCNQTSLENIVLCGFIPRTKSGAPIWILPKLWTTNAFLQNALKQMPTFHCLKENCSNAD